MRCSLSLAASVASFALVACFVGRATAHPFQVDQASEGPPSGGFGISPGDAFGQEFTPTATALDVVEFGGGPHDPNSLSLRVNIRAGALDGPILGTSQIAIVQGAPPMLPVFHFDFASPVPLVAGSLYVLQPVLEPGSATVGLPFLDPGPYAGGRAIIHGAVRGDLDLVFRTGLTVPEPAAGTALTILAVGAAAFVRRRRRVEGFAAS
jgi:MYXO-CTERM domain-containing protein